MCAFKKGRLFCCLYLLLPAMAMAQSTAPVSLKNLLQLVDTRAPSLLADSANVRIRQAQEAATRYNWLPSLKLDYQADLGTNNNLPGGYFSYGIVPGNSRVRTDGNSSTILTDLGIVSFDWEFCNFGGYAAQRQVAASDVQIARAGFVLSKYNLEAYAIGFYFQLLRLQDQLAIQARTITRNEEIARSIGALARSGVRAGVDTSIAGAELSKARLNYIELANQQEGVRLQLATLTGLDAAIILPDTTYEEKLIAGFPAMNLSVPDTTTHPLLQPLEYAVQNSLDREKLVRRSYNPKLSLDAAAWGRGSSASAADEFRPLGTGWGFERSNYLAGIGISFNLFDLKREQLQLHIQQAATNYARRRLDDQRAQLAQTLGATSADLRTAQQRLAEIPYQLNAATAAYRQKLSLYRNGLTDIVELNATLAILYRAETDAANARYLYCMALFRRAVAANQVAALLSAL